MNVEQKLEESWSKLYINVMRTVNVREELIKTAFTLGFTEGAKVALDGVKKANKQIEEKYRWHYCAWCRNWFNQIGKQSHVPPEHNGCVVSHDCCPECSDIMLTQMPIA